MKNLWLICFCIMICDMPAFAKPALDQVNASNILRCGYVEYAPALTHDLKTDAWHGFNADIMAVVADRLGVKLEWTAATSWATVATDLAAHKYDMLCSGFWVHPNVGRFALFSRPFVFQPVFVVARTGDARFHSLPDLNDAHLTMVALDGDNPVNIAAADFPRAKILTLPDTADFSQVLVNVAGRKADFTIVDAATFGAYDENNPGVLKIVDAAHPTRIYPVSYVFGSEDGPLRDAVNASLDEMILDGTMDRIFDKYDDTPQAYDRAFVPFRIHDHARPD